MVFIPRLQAHLMANFSEYGGVSPEWEELIQTTTIPDAGPAHGQSVEQYQSITNEAREAASNEYLAQSGEFP